MSQTDIEQIEVSIEEAKKIVKRGQLAEKLSNNRDFKELILKNYFEDEAVRLVHLKSSPSVDEEVLKQIDNAMVGIGMLKQFLSMSVVMGQSAEREIHDAEMDLDEIRAEMDEEG